MNYSQFMQSTHAIGRYLFVLCLSLVCIGNSLSAQVIIQEVYSSSTFTLKNIGNSSVDLSSYSISTTFSSGSLDARSLDTLSIQCGNLLLAAGEEVTFSAPNFFNSLDGELSLCSVHFFGICISGSLTAYVEWGSTGHNQAQDAINQGFWDGNAVSSFSNSQSIEVIGDQTIANGWSINQSPQICNFTNCETDLFIDDNPIVSNTYSVSNQITSIGTVISGSQVIFDAGDNVLLNPEFGIDEGGIFLANIGGCQ